MPTKATTKKCYVFALLGVYEAQQRHTYCPALHLTSIQERWDYLNNML